MRKLIILLLVLPGLSLMLCLPSCNSNCVDEVLLQTIRMDLKVNSENLGVSALGPFNAADTIRSQTHQFYSYPEHRRFGSKMGVPVNWSFFASAYAQEDCPEQIDYISRMDPGQTEFSLNTAYDGAALGIGNIPAGTNLLDIPEIKSAYLQDFLTNAFLNGGAPSPLTINKNFFLPLDDQWVLFRFRFEEIDGTIFPDSALAFIDMDF